MTGPDKTFSFVSENRNVSQALIEGNTKIQGKQN